MTDNESRTPFGGDVRDRDEETRRLGLRNRILASALAIVAIAAVAFVLLSRGGDVATQGGHSEAAGHADGEHGEEMGEVELEPEAIEAAGIEIEAVTERLAVSPLIVTGTVEANQEQTQQASTLVSGRVERVYAALGDFVKKGAPLAVISSPEAAEMKGKLREAETRLELARRNVDRVKRAENRAGVLAAKARLDEAEATLRRTKRLVDLGAGAGKDLTAAETAYATAKAEFDYQSNIAISREVQIAQAEVETAATEVNHLRQSLQALGADTGDQVSAVTLMAPIAGTVTERTVNAGAGVEAGAALFTIGNLSTVWVIANVPESKVADLRVGSPAEVVTAAPGEDPRSGRIDYIDPRLDEQTRTARVRVEVANPGEKLRVGMFVQVGFQSGSAGADAGPSELVVRSSAIQRVGERAVVFIQKDDEPGHFEVRDVEVGGEVAGYRKILGGLSLGEKVVTKGSFTLKTQLMKGELGEHSH
ncbi:MAG: efflux RND transporter periplasmic adaptor subunit [Acidobacteria bacterium]|nr:efflux RND transporter periplasmic adaptor subunit [Acidobacteriota bacterium]